MELSCLDWMCPCILEEGIPNDERARGFMERKAVEGLGPTRYTIELMLRMEIRSLAIMRRNGEGEHLSRVPSVGAAGSWGRVGPG